MLTYPNKSAQLQRIEISFVANFDVIPCHKRIPKGEHRPLFADFDVGFSRVETHLCDQSILF